MKRRNGVCLCACGCFGRTLRLEVRVHGGVFVATKSQIASRESGMPFESLSPICPKYFAMGESG